MNKKGISTLVIFTPELPRKNLDWWTQIKTVIAPRELEKEIPKNISFTAIEDFVQPGSIYDATSLMRELSLLKLDDGRRLAKIFTYHGYELWWMYCNSLFSYFCLPHTQYEKLLEHLKSFSKVYLYRSPYKNLFYHYLRAQQIEVGIIRDRRFRILSLLPFGIFIQIFITLLSLPILVVKKRKFMIFIGDKFEKKQDYDFRMRFIYKELRQRNLFFVEFIRSLESWKIVLQHALFRKRPVIYSEAVAFLGHLASFFSYRKYEFKKNLKYILHNEIKSDKKFKIYIASHYLVNVHNDIWSIRIMSWILKIIGIKSAFFAAALDRNFHSFLGCKLNSIPTVGILHGVASKNYNIYDFLPGFDGKEMISVDRYGLWSEWWKKYYLENTKAYRSEQLFVSGPMRPLEKRYDPIPLVKNKADFWEVLFVSEQLAVPEEVLPFLETLLNEKRIHVTITFRQFRDGFKDWLLKNNPKILQHPNLKIASGSLQDAIKYIDVAVGTHSTAVLEALLVLKAPIFFQTNKWGDYYNIKSYDDNQSFFADDPSDLLKKIEAVKLVEREKLKNLQERYFGDPEKNGSKWVVDQLEDFIRKGNFTK